MGTIVRSGRWYTSEKMEKQRKGKAKEVTTPNEQNNDNVEINKLMIEEEATKFLKLMK